ncbi:MAG: 3-phosphoshikimate 1-carboxyvinyltransferase [Christensenellales bacterium]|nr:3-phosphoshikimate 1-carboxyvinyltransferase [Clostridiales bacterium]
MVIKINTRPPYEAAIQKGCLTQSGLERLMEPIKAKKAAVITDRNVAKLYLDKLKQRLSGTYELCHLILEGGEQSKTLREAERIYEFLLDNGVTRSDIIIALGGGVIGDIAGFAAATYLRGIRYAQIPTTLLAMIDSSIGGKTAVNLSKGKNLAGSFHQPCLVAIDTSVLKSLPHEEWLNGMGEMIKYGAIMDKKLFERTEKGVTSEDEDIEQLIARCLKIKKYAVEKDTFDDGIRQILNFGHTLGHAIERHSNYSISHGKAIGMGMAMISRWAEQRCLIDPTVAARIEDALKKHGMPVSASASLEELWEQASNDKKRRNDSVTLVLAEQIGKADLLKIGTDDFAKKDITVSFCPSVLKGEIKAPPSKSMTHRAVFCAMLAEGESVIKNIGQSLDIKATLNAAKAIGRQAELKGGKLRVGGKIDFDKLADIDCIESGSTLRFILPVLAALGITAQIKGKESLGARPHKELIELLAQKGCRTKQQNNPFQLDLKGKIKGGDYHIRGDISSQYVSGLLMALPLLAEDSRIILTSKLLSKPYADMTCQCMRVFGVYVEQTDYGYFVKGGQRYKAVKGFETEGDFSNAAFFLCAGALSGKIQIKGLDKHSLQGDKEIINILRKMGAGFEETKDGYIVETKELKGIEIDGSHTPDIIPVTAVTAAFAQGESVIKGVSRLRHKECDRLQAVCEILAKLGREYQVKEDTLRIKGSSHVPQKIECGSHNDHRIAMALSVAALKCGETVVKGAQAIAKSYPNYLLEYKKIGGRYEVRLG